MLLLFTLFANMVELGEKLKEIKPSWSRIEDLEVKGPADVDICWLHYFITDTFTGYVSFFST